jgi:hypothetical protein
MKQISLRRVRSGSTGSRHSVTRCHTISSRAAEDSAKVNTAVIWGEPQTNYARLCGFGLYPGRFSFRKFLDQGLRLRCPVRSSASIARTALPVARSWFFLVPVAGPPPVPEEPNHKLPSGPVVIPTGMLYARGSAYSVTWPVTGSS